MSHIKKRCTWPVVTLVVVALLLVTLASGVAAGKGPGGTTTTIATTTTTTAPSTTTTTTPGQTKPISGSGSLFGDLYVLLRYFGGETKPDGSTAIGGEPLLSVEPGWEAIEVVLEDGTVTYEERLAAVASECIQPVASYERWGDTGTP